MYGGFVAGQLNTSDELLDYVRAVSLRDDPTLRKLRESTAELPMGSAMQVMAEEGQLLGFLVAFAGVTTVVEIGTFTGYSTLCMARSLPADGRVITCDNSVRWSSIARAHWDSAGVSERIEQRIGDGAEVMGELLSELGPGSVDFIFIDADKANYPTYYESALLLLRPGAMMVLDNTLFFGRVLDSSSTDDDTVAIRELNLALRDDDRVDISLLPMADGITLVRKR